MMKPGFDRATQVMSKRLACSTAQLREGFVPSRTEDLEHIVQWRAENAPKPKDLPSDDHRYLTWRYNFGDSQDPGNCSSRLWILKIDGHILGMMGAQHHVLHTQSQTLDIAYPIDLLVRKDLNGSGLGAWINLAMQQQYPILLVIGSGTRESAGLIRRLFRGMPDRNIWKLPVSTGGTLRRVLRNNALSRPISAAADGVISLGRRLKHRSLSAANIRLEPIAQFPQCVADLMQHWPEQDIYLDRSAEFLNWRFMRNPGIEYQALMAYRGTERVGYIVYHLYYSPENDQTQAAIDDLMWDRQGDEAVARALLQQILSASISYLIDRKAKLIILATYGQATNGVLQQLGFRRRDDQQTFSIFTRSPDDNHLYDAERWYLSSAEVHGPDF